MAGFGSELRAERERRGLSLDALSAETKISPKHLRALEQDDYLALPGGVFRKGIVRAYLAAVGLEEAPWLERFTTSLAQVAPVGEDAQRAEEEAWARFARNVKRGRPQKHRPTLLRWAGVLLLFLLLAAGAWALWRFLHQAHDTAQPAPAHARVRNAARPGELSVYAPSRLG